MTYQKINVPVANAIFNLCEITIEKHYLGYYEAIGRNLHLQDSRLCDLCKKILEALISESPNN